MLVHISDIKAYQSCPRAANYGSMVWQGLEPVEPYGPFHVGKVVHSALEHYYALTPRRPLTEALDMAVRTESEQSSGLLGDSAVWFFKEHNDMACAIVEHYAQWITSFEHTSHPWGDPQLEFLRLEPIFQTPLPRLHTLEGRFDGIVRRLDDGTLWLFETKTTVSIETLQKSLVLDEQAGAYIYAAQKLLGEPLQGVIYNILRKKAPAVPATLARGGLSQNKSIDTTEAVYLKAALEAHPDLSEAEVKALYDDILVHLRAQGNRFFSRTVVRRSPYEVKTIADKLSRMATRMKNETVFPPYPDMIKCNRCLFNDPCIARTQGDYATEAQLLAESYRERTDRTSRPVVLYDYFFLPSANDRVAVWRHGEEVLNVEHLEWAIEQAALYADVVQDGPLGADLRRAGRAAGVFDA